MLRRDRVDDASIVLVSDLETAPEDFGALTRTLAELRRRGIGFTLVPLAPSSESRLLFERALGPDAFADVTPTGDERRRRAAEGRAPLALVAFGALFFVALAAHERWTARLRLPRGSAA